MRTLLVALAGAGTLWMTSIHCFAQDLEQGVSFDVTAQTLSEVTTPPPVLGGHAQQGTGEIVDYPLLSDEDLQRLQESAPLYAPYEAAEHPAAEETFVPYGIIGDSDGRSVILDTTQFPARAVVRISFKHARFGDTRGCTGAMISERVVLTAGHCVHTGGPNGQWHREFIVYPGVNGPVEPFGNCRGVLRIYAINGWLTGATLAERRLYDMAALELTCDIGARTGWFAMRAPPTIAGAISVQGYPCNLVRPPANRQWISTDQVREAGPEKLFYDNDTTGCTSGAPVTPAGTAEIIAVHTNGAVPEDSGAWKTHNAGTRLTATRIANLEAWMERAQ